MKMSLKPKRIRSINWDQEEKQLFRLVIKKFKTVLENKSLDTNTNQLKTKTWEEIHKKFNKLNYRLRSLKELKMQWKTMKINARKEGSKFKRATKIVGGGGRPQTPSNDIIKIKDILNFKLELLRDENIYDSDGNSTSVETVVENDIFAASQESDDHKPAVSQDSIESMSNNYVDTIVNNTKTLKDQEHEKRMEILEVELNIKKEKLKSAILEREILEIRKKKEMMEILLN